jgi:hypothetical protein
MVTNNGQIRCFCTEDPHCPMEINQDEHIDTVPLPKRSKIEAYLNQTKTRFHYCMTNSICGVKKVKRVDGTEFMKYYCDHHLHASDNSIRKSVIAYRDCRVDTTNNVDRGRVLKTSAEHCCSSGDYCNFGLEPQLSVRDLQELTMNKNNNKPNQIGIGEPTEYVETSDIYSNTSLYDSPPIHSTIFSPTNIVLVIFFS